jgi:hypothetical protein
MIVSLKTSGAVTLAFLLPAFSWAQTAKPDFTGTYTFVPKRSTDLKDAITKAAGRDYTTSGKSSELVRLSIRKWLEGVTSDGDKRILTIEQTAAAFKAGLGDEVNIYYFGREALSSGPGEGSLKVTVTWKGDQIITQERQTKGKGAITTAYTLLPDGKLLLAVWRLEHESLLQPLEVNLFFERVPS